MSAAETYLRELRRALPLGCRRRLVAEVREHFASAGDAGEAERETIERLGPARVVAAQLVADLRSGALGHPARLTAALTTTPFVAAAAVLAATIVAGSVFAGRHTSPAPTTTPQRTAGPTVTLDPQTGEVRMVMYAVEKAARNRQAVITSTVSPTIRLYLSPVPTPQRRPR